MRASNEAKSKTKPAKPRAANSAPKSTDFPGAFAGLKKILQKHASNLKVVKDTATHYYLDTQVIGKNKKPVFFGAAVINKNYVSFHFMPAYCCPELLKTASPELKHHRQGKACFNFATPDPKLFAELEQLTAVSVEKFHTYLKNCVAR